MGDISMVANNRKLVYYHPTTKTTYNNVRTTASEAEIFGTAKILGKLLSKTYNKIVVVEESQIFDEDDPNYLDQ